MCFQFYHSMDPEFLGYIKMKHELFFVTGSSAMLAYWDDRRCIHYAVTEMKNFMYIRAFLVDRELPFLSRDMQRFLTANGFTMNNYTISDTPRNTSWEKNIRILSPSKIAFVLNVATVTTSPPPPPLPHVIHVLDDDNDQNTTKTKSSSSSSSSSSSLLLLYQKAGNVKQLITHAQQTHAINNNGSGCTVASESSPTTTPTTTTKTHITNTTAMATSAAAILPTGITNNKIVVLWTVSYRNVDLDDNYTFTFLGFDIHSNKIDLCCRFRAS